MIFFFNFTAQLTIVMVILDQYAVGQWVETTAV